MAPPLRFGILGAARIAPAALIRPARAVSGVQVAAIAARDPARAQTFARTHNIPRVHASYAALVDDPELDAIYIPLPNALHAEWTLRALRAGKHVLCEKPLASNAREAEAVVRVADESGRVLMEAFHYRYHPLAQRLQQIVAGGEIGAVNSLEAYHCVPLFRPGDIRFRYDLGGGALMDTGCYCIDLLRFLIASQDGWEKASEAQVIWARARLAAPQVDRLMEAALLFSNGVRARLKCSLAAFPPFYIAAIVRGAHGVVRVSNPFVPHHFNYIEVTTAAGTRRERLSKEPTYNFQLRAFVDAVRGEPSTDGSATRLYLTNGHAAVANLRLIDAVYAKAGLKARGDTTFGIRV